MGLFSDTCNALVDKNTGRALTGDALAAAQNDPTWPTCGNKVSKRARFCNKCGKPAPGGWWKCPQCGKWIGNDSHFCPHCNAPLYPDDRVAMAGGVWRKEPGLFAQRFEIGDVRRLLAQKLQVQAGTAAILMDAGEISGILEAGWHQPDGLARKINWFGNPPPRSVVLVDAGEVIVPLHLEGLRTAEHIPIEFYGELVLRFKGDKDAARAFCGNVLKGDRSYAFSQIAGRVEPLIRGAVDEMCNTATLEDLVKDPERRIRLQERIEKRIETDLPRAVWRWSAFRPPSSPATNTRNLRRSLATPKSRGARPSTKRRLRPLCARCITRPRWTPARPRPICANTRRCSTTSTASARQPASANSPC
ncbi:MAG: zinc ribbon domain-containing protein [Kiritimatiellia bacterium]